MYNYGKMGEKVVFRQNGLRYPKNEHRSCPQEQETRKESDMVNLEKQSTLGRETIIALFDAGTFVEMGAYIRRRGADAPYTAVLTGYGSIGGKLAFAFAQDPDRTSGALDDIGAAKIERLYEEALRVGAPVIGFFAGAGIPVADGSSALGAYGRLMKCAATASGIIPQIAYIAGECGGLGATVASMYDFIVTAQDASAIAFHVSGIKIEDKTAYAEANGLSSINAENLAAAMVAVRDLVTVLPRNNRDTADTEPTDDPARAVAADQLTGLALCRALADGGRVISLYDGFAPELVTALLSIGGRTCGVIANDAELGDGKLTPKGARKAARLISFCDSFSIPVVTLVDSMGVDTAAPREPSPAFGKLAKAYITATTAKISVVVGNAIGAAYTLLGSRALGVDLALALPEAVISPLNPATAVAFLWNDRITAEHPRAAVEADWCATEGSPMRAAEVGDIDDIVNPAELRARLSSALYMLAEKADTTPDRKHGVPTL